MKSEPDIARIAALIGDPARANMLCALMDSRARTAAELAEIAGVGAPTASAHLAKLADARLLFVEKQGRHRYYRLADSQVAETLESLSALSDARASDTRRPGPREPEMRALRTCYDHLAGTLAVRLTEHLVASGLLTEAARDFRLTPAGAAAFDALGVDLAIAERKRRAFARRCLDWSERRAHLGGALGASLRERCEALGWVRRDSGPDRIRVAHLTPAGARGLEQHFGFRVSSTAGRAPLGSRS